MSRESCPFAVEANETRGRFLTSNRDVKQGEVIFQERPLVVGPVGVGDDKSKTFSTCLGCYKFVTSHYRCSKCGWPVCNAQCEMIPDHANFECTVFAECPVSPITHPLEYEKIKILRCLILKEKEPEKWELLMNLEPHKELRKQDVCAVSRDISFYKFIKDECHLKQFQFDVINRIAGVCAINSYNTSGSSGLNPQDSSARFATCLFYYASWITHECIPNTRTVIQLKGKSYLITVYAATDIKSGDVLTTAYVDPNCGTLERRALLLDKFYFSCRCQRCRDPHEMGSYLSAMKCIRTSCRNGWLIPRNPLDPCSEWICDQKGEGCDASVPPGYIGSLIQDVKARMRSAATLAEMTDLLDFCKQKALHKNHYLVLNMEYEMLRFIDGILEMTRDENEIFRLAKWQIELSRHCLSIADLIQPGSNKFRGNLLYHLQNALLIICHHKMSQCADGKDLEVVRKRCKKQFAEALEIMKEAKVILMAEAVSTPEWQRGTLLSLEQNRIKSLMAYLSFSE